MLALEREWTWLRPRLDDEIMRFMEALMREIRIDAGRVILGADAAHEAADDAAAREVVEHRVFFGDVHRIALQRQGAAEDRDLDLLRALDKRAGDEIGRRHQSIGVLVMLVDADAVEAEPLGIDQEVDEVRVFLGAFDRIIKAVGQHDPG